MDIEASARQHDVPDEDMLHDCGTTGEPSRLTIQVSPRSSDPPRTGDPLEIGVVTDDDGSAVIHAMSAREKFLKGWWIE